jgi:hypothetical protein
MPEKYLAIHAKWRGEFILNDDGTFIGGQGQRGTGLWLRDGDDLILKWHHWDSQRLTMTNNGYTSDKLTLISNNKSVSISFCTTCMGRLEYLKQTLPENIEVASKFDNIEFVLLDYNSNDGLEEWVADNMMRHIESGLLAYYRNDEPEHFDMSHAKNMSHRLASKEIVCNLDADNKISEEFVRQLRFEFANDKNCILKPNSNLKGNAGRIAISKENFMFLRGYDESAVGWGNEDQDFFNKADIWGIKPVRVNDAYSIPHSDKERGENYKIQHIRKTSRSNANVLRSRLREGYLVSNMFDSFGDGLVRKNFEENIVLEYIESGRKPSTVLDTYLFETSGPEKDTKIFLFKEPQVFIKTMVGSTIKGISSYWFQKGKWQENDGNLVLKWNNWDLEIFNRISDTHLTSGENNLIKNQDIE